jgi:hypothetical protein
VKHHGGPVSGAYELDARVCGAGQIVGDQCDLHRSFSDVD